MKRQSHIDIMRASAEANRQHIQRLFGWSDLRYAEFQEAKGMEYLLNVICPDGYGFDELRRSRIYWRWWINQWNRRDDDFLHAGTFNQEREDLGNESAYYQVHSYQFLRDQYPHRIVFEKTYSEMIGELLDQK